MIIFRGMAIMGSHKQNLLAGSTVRMTESCNINETLSETVAALSKT
jgi:hypothetical protein